VLALADVQRRIRDALVLGRDPALGAILVGGLDPARRLAIHQRHYRTTLVSSLLTRFPATAWLVGSEFVAAAAEAFVATHPPSRPCIAEYGDAFPPFLGSRPTGRPVPYLEQFATLEWHIARVSLAVDHRPLPVEHLQTVGPDALVTASLSLQPGVHYQRADWSIDELFSCYLSDVVPEQFALTPGEVCIEVRGARGTLQLVRLAAGEFSFRSALASGVSLGDAVALAAGKDSGFDATQAIIGLVAGGFVAAIHPAQPADEVSP
jgi:hypothetical protein